MSRPRNPPRLVGANGIHSYRASSCISYLVRVLVIEGIPGWAREGEGVMVELVCMAGWCWGGRVRRVILRWEGRQGRSMYSIPACTVDRTLFILRAPMSRKNCYVHVYNGQLTGSTTCMTARVVANAWDAIHHTEVCSKLRLRPIDNTRVIETTVHTAYI